MGKGYALISEKHIKGNGEDFHLFIEPKIVKNDTGHCIINMTIPKYSECKEERSEIEFHNLKLNKYIIHYKDKDYPYEFYRNDNCDVYYFKGEINARIGIAAFVGIKACGTCVSTLYANKNN